MATTRHTNYRPRRNRAAETAPAQTNDVVSETIIGEGPRRYVYTKTSTAPIRIRKGPGLEFEHNGQYVSSQKKVEIVEIENGWGLLKSYAKTRDGWVCLEFLDKPAE